MYLRFETWQEVNSVEEVEQGNWYNVFQVPFPCADIRLRLKGYGWKPNSTDENIPVLYEGVYKCYYRKHGGSDWVFFATAVVERASTEDAFVYKDIIVDTGYLEKDMYEVKVIASYGDRFDAWGGAIEGINRIGQYWYGLEALMDRPLGINVVESVEVGEYCYGGKEIIELNLVEEIGFIDYFDRILHGYLIGVTEDVITHAEYVNIFWNTYKTFIQVINVQEYVAFWSDLIQNWSPQENINIEENWYGYIFPFYFYYYESINVVENVVMDRWDIFRNINAVENIGVVDALYALYPIPPWRPNVFEEVLAVDEVILFEMFTTVWEDLCSGTFSLWSAICYSGSFIAEEVSGEFHIGFGAADTGSTLYFSRYINPSSIYTNIHLFEYEVSIKFDDAYYGNSWGSVLIRLGNSYICSFRKAENANPLDNWALRLANSSIDSGFTFAPNVWHKVRMRGSQSYNSQNNEIWTSELFVDEILVSNSSGFVGLDVEFDVSRSGSATPQAWIDNIRIRDFGKSNEKYIVVKQDITKSEVVQGRKDLGFSLIQNISVQEYFTFWWDALGINLVDWISSNDWAGANYIPLDIVENVASPTDFANMQLYRTIYYSDCTSLSGWTNWGGDIGDYIKEVVGGTIHLKCGGGAASYSYLNFTRENIVANSHVKYEGRMWLDTTIPSGATDIFTLGFYNLTSWNWQVGFQFRSDRSIYVNADTVANRKTFSNAFPLGTYFNIKVEMWGGSWNCFYRLWIDDVWIGDGWRDIGASGGNLLWYGSAVWNPTYYNEIYLDEIFYYTIGGDEINTTKRTPLVKQDVNVAESVTMVRV